MTIEGDDGAAAAGTAADLLGGSAAAAGGEGSDNGGSNGGADDAGAGGDDGGEPEYLNLLSIEGGDADNPSNRDFAKGKGWKTADDILKSYRELERLQRDSGRIKVPSEDATPEEKAAYAKAIGVPDDAKGYTIAAPKDDAGNDLPLNTALIDRLAQAAHKLGTPKAAFEGLVSDFIQYQMDEAAQVDTEMQNLADALVKSWGAETNAKLAAVDRAAQALGVTREEMIALRNAWGPEKALDRFVKLGEGMAEDVMMTGGKGRFAVSAAEAGAEIERLKKDPAFDPVKNPNDKARWERLQSIKAAAEARKEDA